MSDMNEMKSILKVLDYTKANKEWFDSLDLVAGYHSVELNGQHFRGNVILPRACKKSVWISSARRYLMLDAPTVAFCISSHRKLRWAWG